MSWGLEMQIKELRAERDKLLADLKWLMWLYCNGPDEAHWQARLQELRKTLDSPSRS